MTPLITYTDFIYPLNPNLSSQNDIAKITNVIALETKTFLLKILGYLEYNKFITDNLTSTNWVNFVNGLTYTNANGDTIIYEGIKEPLKYYCFMQFLKYNNSYTLSSGEGSPLFENTEKDQTHLKFIQAQNKMFELVQGCENSVYQFLKDFDTDFTDLNFTGFSQKINSFGI